MQSPWTFSSNAVPSATSEQLARKRRSVLREGLRPPCEVPHFSLQDSDTEDVLVSDNLKLRSLSTGSCTSHGSGSAGDTLQEFELGDSDADEDTRGDWMQVLDMLDMEDQYRFDPQEVAEMVHQGTDLERLSAHLCEVMADRLEQHVSEVAMEPEPDHHPLLQTTVITGDLDTCMTPPEPRQAAPSSLSGPRLNASDLHRRLTSIAGMQSPQSMPHHSPLLHATRRSLIARGDVGEGEVSAQLKLIQDAWVEAHRRHRQSIVQAVQEATGKDEGITCSPSRSSQSVLEGRIQEAVSAACMSSNLAASHIAESDDKLASSKSRVVELAMKYSAEAVVSNFNLEEKEGRKKWIVVGGQGNAGIIVRTGGSLKSTALPVRLMFGAWLEELEVAGNRLHFRRLRGDGPDFGWVSINLCGKRPLVSRVSEEDWAACRACKLHCADGYGIEHEGTEVRLTSTSSRSLSSTFEQR